MDSLDQSLTKPRSSQQALLECSHPSPVALMIVAEEVQEAMQRQDPKLNSNWMPQVPSLAPGDTAGDDDVAEEPRA